MNKAKKILEIALIIISTGIFIIDYLLSAKYFGRIELFIIPAILMISCLILCQCLKFQYAKIIVGILFASMIYYRLIIPQIQKLFGI